MCASVCARAAAVFARPSVRLHAAGLACASWRVNRLLRAALLAALARSPTGGAAVDDTARHGRPVRPPRPAGAAGPWPGGARAHAGVMAGRPRLCVQQRCGCGVALCDRGSAGWRASL
jgi:hypothetical protein